VRQGRVVFLLDALDQTHTAVHSLGAFLQSGHLPHCPVLLTGRPETRQTRASAFRTAHWDTIWLEPFNEGRIRRFLGETLAEQLLPGTDESWQNPESYQRKAQWADLLKVPLLLHEMRALAQHGNLDGLKNREAVYDRTVGRLIQKGLDTLSDSPQASPFRTDDSIRKQLQSTAWRTIEAEMESQADIDGNFTGRLAGQPFDALVEQQSSLLEMLGQINVTTLDSLFDEHGFSALTWRHLSFCEYFAGVHLAELAREAQQEVVAEHGRDPRWRWIFRFALSYLDREHAAANNDTAKDKSAARLHELARDLVRFGNPFLVYDAIDLDHITLPQSWLDRLCRWLVHRDDAWGGRDYRSAWRDGDSKPDFDDRVLDILETLFDRDNRDSRCLHPAWELLEASQNSRSEDIRNRFLGEFQAILGDPAHPDHETALSLVPEDRLLKRGLITEQEVEQRRQRTNKKRLNFVRCPANEAEDGRPFDMGTPETDTDANPDEKPQHPVIVSPFLMQSTPITNRQFELFDPAHRHSRDQYSSEDECPVIYVSHHMAEMFCLWLGDGCRLPTEAQWEYACRAGSTTKWCFDGDESQLKNYAWYSENSEGTTHAVGLLEPNAWGLFDMHGNVWEWCADWFDERYYKQLQSQTAINPLGPPNGSRRVDRGGSWCGTAGYCRSAFRSRCLPSFCSYFLGFRVAQVPSGR
jgi:formylglycine-generating enzyme required for sulfatase activity